MNQASNSKRLWLVPEVVQISAMDCGPATLKAILEGYRVPVSYGRLREACQTDVDGTSIDVIEETALLLGLDAEQVLLPIDHLLLNAPDSLPAIVVTRPNSGDTHFVVVWRRVGSFVQVMDPAVGRRWPPNDEDLREAEIVCRGLGLSDLLERMPAGLLQMVGETGWRLSHGEKSRIFLARALLQQARVMVLDESFGALDPETLCQCLKFVFERAPALVVIAHP